MKIAAIIIAVILIFTGGFYVGKASSETEFKVLLLKKGFALIENDQWRLKKEKDLFVKIKLVTGTLVKNPKRK